jgi:GNAT superfamily N-acetyltransferase
MEAVLETTTGGDAELQPLVAAQEAEVMARYGVDDAGPGLSPDTPCLLARLEERPVGCVALGQLSDAVGEVKRMYVDPAARGHRIGRLLLHGVEALARARGYRVLRLETGTQQPEALRLYDSAGWQRIECYGYFKGDPTTICFEKQLPEPLQRQRDR